MTKHEEFRPKTVFEPFKIKMVEPLAQLTADQRAQAIGEASYNVFRLPARAVTFDFLTDSGTSAMSAEQWASMLRGDESYAGSISFERFEKTVQELTGLPIVIPTHQGRAAEMLLMSALLKAGEIVIGNTHFDTTRANIQVAGGIALDLPAEENGDADTIPFKGNIDLKRLEAALKTKSPRVAMVIMTVTNNSIGGQPVSMANLKAVRELTKRHQVPLFIDAARFAENAYFIKTREPGFEGRSPRQVAREMFEQCDGVLMSAKKDAFGNIGGFLAIRDTALADEVKNLMVVTEGFPTYGGLAGRDLEALATGLDEILDEHYLAYRIRSTAYLGDGLSAAGLKLIKPFGGHAVYIDAAKTLPMIPVSLFPGQSLSVALYEKIGIRCCEVGSVMLGSRDPATGKEIPAPKELVRLAIPRRVYTQSHVDYVIEMAHLIRPSLDRLPGYQFTYEAPVLRHFTARFKPVAVK